MVRVEPGQERRDCKSRKKEAAVYLRELAEPQTSPGGAASADTFPKRLPEVHKTHDYRRKSRIAAHNRRDAPGS